MLVRRLCEIRPPPEEEIEPAAAEVRFEASQVVRAELIDDDHDDQLRWDCRLLPLDDAGDTAEQ
jgi:hypothetical protein